MIEQSHEGLSLRRQCWLLSVSRAGLSYQPAPVDEQNLQIMRRLDEWYIEHPDLGHRRLVVLLREEGWSVNIKRVRRLRALMGLETQFPKPNISKPGVPRQRFLYLLKGLIISRVHQMWATARRPCDITYIPMPKGFFYVMAILDLHSRYVLHWQLSNSLEADWCVETLRQSLQKWGSPQIFNTDQGSQFTSDEFVGLLEEHQISISWDSKGRALDNIYVERFWRTLKYEDVYLRNYQTGSELRKGLTRYFQYYNYQRPNQS